MNDLTWTCHVCKDERPDHLISVFKRTSHDGVFTENIRYCNDRVECVTGAETYSHLGPS